MNKDDFYLSILIGIISGLIVLLGQFVGESIKNVALKIGVAVTLPFILFIIFIKLFEKKITNLKK